MKHRIITDLDELCRRLNLPLSVVYQGTDAAADFPMAVPESLLTRMEKGNPLDPVLLQFLPQSEELISTPGFSGDPLQESELSASGILQKYRRRVLVLTTGCCDCACRYCFRRHTVHSHSLLQEGLLRTTGEEQTAFLHRFFEPVHRDTSIKEVIFSGGDPLTIGDEVLKNLLNYIKSLPFVNRVRFHTRTPVLNPARITDELAETLREVIQSGKSDHRSLTVYFVFQINHPKEIDSSVEKMFRVLRQSGVILLSQSVLLRRINDNAETLCELFEKLADHGVLPYYLHQLDKVAGAAAFEVDPQKGLDLMKEVTETLSGYAVPRYVREIPGDPCKMPVMMR